MEASKFMVDAVAKKLLELSKQLEHESYGEVLCIGEESATEWATACLRAAMVGVEVVRTNDTPAAESVVIYKGVSEKVGNEATLFSGDTLAVIRGGV